MVMIVIMFVVMFVIMLLVKRRPLSESRRAASASAIRNFGTKLSTIAF
jgi:hypothetical protein